jgi:hypothetical protein
MAQELYPLSSLFPLTLYPIVPFLFKFLEWTLTPNLEVRSIGSTESICHLTALLVSNNRMVKLFN